MFSEMWYLVMSTQALSVLQWLQFSRKKGQLHDYHFIQPGYIITGTEMKNKTMARRWKQESVIV